MERREPAVLAPDFALLFQCSPVAQVLVRTDEVFSIAAVSEEYLRLTETRRERLQGKPMFEAAGFGADLADSFQRAIQSKTPDKLTLGLAEKYYHATNTPILDAEGAVAYLLHCLELNPIELPSIEAAAPADREDSFLVRLDDAIRPLTEADEIVHTAVRLLGTHLRVDSCGYCLFETDQETFHIFAQYVAAGVASMTGTHKLSDFGAEACRCMQKNLPHIVGQTETEAHLHLGIGALMAIPVHKDGKLIASIGVSQRTARAWLPREMELVRVVADRCWESMQRAHITRALAKSEQRLRLAQRAARIGTFEWLVKENRIVWTPELEALYGIGEGTFEGSLDDWKKRVVPGDLAGVLNILTDCTARRQAECVYDFRAVLPGGEYRWLRGCAEFYYDSQGEPERMIGVNFDIDSQKRAEENLRSSEQRLRAIVDGTREYVGLLTAEGKVLEANRASLEFSGMTLKEIAGRPFWDTPWFAGTPGAPEVIKQAVSRAAAGAFVSFEITLRHPSGESWTFDVSLHPVKNENGSVILIVPEARNITERKQIEERLREQWQTFDTALSNTPDITYTFDPEGRFTYANRQLVNASQRSLQDTIGKTVGDLGYPPDLAARIQSQIKRVVETKETLRDQTPFRLPNGEWRDYEYIYVPVLGDDGKVRAVAGASRDITERIDGEKRLRESEARFRQLIDSMPQLAWSSAPDGRGELYNRQWLDYTGLSFEESQERGWVTIHSDDLAATRGNWMHCLQSGDPYETEYRCRRHDGEYRWFLARATAIRDEQGRVQRWFGTCTDIHAQKLSEAELRRAHRELEEFSYVASHDLQEPLRMVNIYAHLILRQVGDADGTLGQYAAFVRQGVTRMETLLTDLLNFSRAVHTEAPAAGRADLSAALEEALSVMRGRIDEAGAVITAGPLPKVHGDTEQIAHVFQNLISNSLKYRKKDQAPQVEINAVLESGFWNVSVRDNGIGFAPEYAQRIFGLFKRLHKDEYPGTGLGLAICQRIVERYGGSMWAESQPGEGASFYFSLPAG